MSDVIGSHDQPGLRSDATRACKAEADPFDAMPPGATIIFRFLSGLALMICSLTLIGFAITELGVLRGVRNWDESINDSLAVGRSNWASDLGELVTSLGDTMPILLINGVVLIVLAALRKWRAMALVPMALLAEITTFLAVNHLVGRPRPDVERLGPLPGTDSYPSGHIAATLVCWVGIAALLHLYGRVAVSRVFGVVAIILTIAMGWARVYVGMHHFLDVVFGLAMGIAALSLAMYTLGQRRSPDHSRNAVARG